MVLGVATAILTARTLGPNKLGVSGLVGALSNQVSTILSLIPAAYLIREYKQQEQARARRHFVELVLNGQLRTVTAVALLIYLLIGLGFVHDHWLLSVAAVVPLLYTLTVTPAWILQSEHQQATQYKIQFLAAVISLILTASLLTPDSPAGSDLLITSTSSGLGAIHLWLSWREGRRLRFTFNRKAYKNFIGHIKQARIIYATGIVILCYTTLEVPLIGIFCGTQDVGLYRAALQWSSAFQGILSIVPIVLYPKFIEWNAVSPKLLWEKQLRLAGLWGGIAALSIVLCAVSIDQFFGVLFGAAFAGASLTALLLTASRFVIVINGIFCWGLWARGQDRQMLSILSSVAIFSLLGNIFLLPKFGIVVAAALNLFSECLVLILAAYLCRPKT
jgi:O-antigen/teichoic acid export membrane protein